MYFHYNEIKDNKKNNLILVLSGHGVPFKRPWYPALRLCHRNIEEMKKEFNSIVIEYTQFAQSWCVDRFTSLNLSLKVTGY